MPTPAKHVLALDHALSFDSTNIDQVWCEIVRIHPELISPKWARPTWATGVYFVGSRPGGSREAIRSVSRLASPALLSSSDTLVGGRGCGLRSLKPTENVAERLSLAEGSFECSVCGSARVAIDDPGAAGEVGR